METLDLLHRDEHLVAVHKPAGLLVHRSPIDRRETRFALQLVRDQIGQRVYPVHRLDKPTSGVLLFALSPAVAARLAAAFASGAVTKDYLAVVRGVPPLAGEIDHPLQEEPDRLDGYPDDAPRGVQAALTLYHRLAETELPFAVGRYPTSRYALLAARPRTGRRHQLRRHLKHIFHPIIGDTRHGEGRHNRFFRDALDCRRLLLHAAELAFPHPESGTPVRVTAPLPADLLDLLDRLGWRDTVPPAWRSA